jgi:SM-20-related protein
MMPDSVLARDLERNGYAIDTAFLDVESVTALAGECRTLHAQAKLTPAAMGRAGARRLDPSRRGDSTHWLDPATPTRAQSAYWSRIEALRVALNRELMLGLNELEAHYALYPPGSLYARHRDRFRDDDARVLSSVLYLNENWDDDDGGALRLHLDTRPRPALENEARVDPAAHMDVSPRSGTLVLFLSAEFEHEVLPARRERLSIAGWFRRSGALRF